MPQKRSIYLISLHMADNRITHFYIKLIEYLCKQNATVCACVRACIHEEFRLVYAVIAVNENLHFDRELVFKTEF